MSKAGKKSVRMGLSVGDQIPPTRLQDLGIRGKKAVIFFYGADDAPSCSKELAKFDEQLPMFKRADVEVVGVRNERGIKGTTKVGYNLAVDEGDEVRNEFGIKKDLFGALGGRETYVVDATGKVVSVHNNQFDPESHVTTALSAAQNMPASGLDLKQLAGVIGINLY
eukprot:CAMPEP_0119301096 /NCGR_PEP_ID=MMETSP1333-20130426/2929_1 /TAXON_ID=418940 /ORGANISM="Scyphosphaera apsteinii, Strain RCC1455" /LENGTH=166 /DNA_ID=CAMNT_0007303075 /DNA_START=144 /DNA_END=644 /DNA_ORIENTATION=+